MSIKNILITKCMRSKCLALKKEIQTKCIQQRNYDPCHWEKAKDLTLQNISKTTLIIWKVHEKV